VSTQAFNAFDKDGGGSIDKEELHELFRSLGQQPTEEELDNMIRCADTDGNGTIDFEEFATLMAHMMVSHESPQAQYDKLQHAFSIFDEDQSGFVSTEEMMRVMLNLGEDVTVEDVEQIVQVFDKDDDGSINYEEFAQGILEEKLLRPAVMKAVPIPPGEAHQPGSPNPASAVRKMKLQDL